MPKLAGEDKAHAFSYLLGAIWAVTFLIYTPTAYANGLDVLILIVWMAVTIGGAIMAIAGVVLGIDIKLELPGVVILAVGPALYAVLQLFLVVSAQPGREALAVFSLWLLAALAPRVVGLVSAARKGKQIAIAESHVK